MAIIWDKNPEPDYTPVVIEEELTIDEWLDEVEGRVGAGVNAAVEEIIAEAEQSEELAKEVEDAKGFYKGFGK